MTGEVARSDEQPAASPGSGPLRELDTLVRALDLRGSREDFVAEVTAHLPEPLAQHRVELGLVDEQGRCLEMYTLHGHVPGESTSGPRMAEGHRLAPVHDVPPMLVRPLRDESDPVLRVLVELGYRQRLLVPVTVGTTMVGVLAVTVRDEVDPALAQVATLTGAVISSRAHRLAHPDQGDDPRSLRAQVTQLRTTARLMARTDALTRLPNRAAAFQAIAEATSERHEGAFAFIDVDHLKMTNDRLGHGSGDLVLREIARRLRGIAGGGRVDVFRVGGDEFGALSSGPAEELRGALEQVADGLAHDPVRLDGRDVHVGFSAGVYPIGGGDDEHHHGIEEIVSRAESAARVAKRSGRGRVVVHETPRDEHHDPHAELRRMDEVRSAVLAGRLSLVAQPITSVVEGVDTPMDAEVLVRLADEQGRLLLPDDFVALAEQYDVVNALDRAVLSRVVATLADGAPQRRVSCNISPHSMLDDVFVDWAHDLVRSAGQGGRLVVELTERLPIGRTEAVRAGMDHLATTGVHFALDDFGAGTTSYGNLRELPLDVLKVDGVLVRGCLSSGVDLAMLRATLDVAHALGIRAIAEGVETEDQLAAVVGLGADAVQGYYFGQPLPWAAR